jgi:hypothetical protein
MFAGDANTLHAEPPSFKPSFETWWSLILQQKQTIRENTLTNTNFVRESSVRRS